MVDFFGSKNDRVGYPPIIDKVSQALIRRSVEDWFAAHPLPPGPAPTPEEIEAVVVAWLEANPPEIVIPPDGVEVDVSGSVQAYLTENMETILAPHINHPTPHPAYDNIPSLVLIYENGLI